MSLLIPYSAFSVWTFVSIQGIDQQIKLQSKVDKGILSTTVSSQWDFYNQMKSSWQTDDTGDMRM